MGSKLFSDDLMQECKDNENVAQFIPPEMKNKINLMVTEQGLYAKVIMLRRKCLNFVATYKNKMKLNSISKVNLQDHNVDLILTLIGFR